MLVKIERMAYGGTGVGTNDSGVEMAVPFTLPGELVDVGEAERLRIIESSAARETPACIHFGRCGGCHYQHAEYPVQVEIKREILRGILAGALGNDLPEIGIRTGEPWGYRNRVRMRVETVEGVVRLGYSRPRSNEFLPIEECPIAASVLWRLVAALEQLAGADDACRMCLERTVEVELFCSADQASVQMALYLRQRIDGRTFANFCSKLKETVPELAGAGAAMAAELGRKTRKAWAGATWGAAGLMYQAGGRSYWVSRKSFFQVNRSLVDEMIGLVTEGRTAKVAWDLYAGVGLFSRALAARAARVVAVEGDALAVADLRQSGDRVRVVHMAAVKFLRGAVLERERPDLVVMDPPRAGVGTEGCGLLARIAAPGLVYVSCDPQTLGRDVAVLARAGYVAERIWLIDMFPQTFHIETVIVLEKRT